MCKLHKNRGGDFIQINEDNKSVTKTIDILASDVVKYMTEKRLTLSAAESCTGGLISVRITDVPGSSQVFIGSAVTYTERMKMELLGVRAETLRRYTVYSEQTAKEMCLGIRRLTGSDFAVAVTGIAGPSGALPGKPVGTVYAAVCCGGGCRAENLMLYKENGYEKSDRRSIRELTALKTLRMLADALADFDQFD